MNKAATFAVPSACTDCGTSEGLGWWRHWNSVPGMAQPRCRACYLDRTRRRQTPERKQAGPSKAVRPAGRAWDRVRRQVLAEETHCGICGEVVDKALRFPDPMSASVDHVVPWRDGGAWYDRENLRLAHFRCNASHNRSEWGKARRGQRDRLLRAVARDAWRPMLDVEGSAF